MKLEQEKQFVPTDECLANLFKLYSLKFISHEAATSGIENTTLIVSINKAKYVARIYRQGKKSDDEIQLELNFMQHLMENGIKVPKVIKNIHGKLITVFNYSNTTWQLIVMEFVDGVHAEAYSRGLLKDMAETQANMHLLSMKYKLPHESNNKLEILRENYFIKQIDRSSIKSSELEAFLARAEKFNLKLDPHLPSGLCHLDYDKDNIISKNSKIEAVLDFDDLAIAPFVVCLGYTLWHVYAYNGKEMMQYYLSEYEKLRPLKIIEKQYLTKIILFRHYVVSSLKILNGHTLEREISEYLKLESAISADSL